MNQTHDYQDQLDGNSLACKPGHVAKGLNIVCNIGMPIFGFVSLANGLCFLHLVYIQHRHRRLFERQTRDVGNVSNAQNSPTMHSAKDSKDVFRYVQMVLLSLAATSLSTSLLFFVYKYGTMYPTTHVRGQIGDAASVMHSAMLAYSSLLSYRGAIRFKKLIPKPKGSLFHFQEPTNRCSIPSISTLFDMLQSWLAPVIALILWSLLRAGVYKRGWCVFWMSCLYGMCGLRLFNAIIIQKLASLRQIASIVVKAKTGTREDQNRRRGFLVNHWISLAIDLMGVFLISVLLPLSFVFFGSTFNSRQYAIHTSILYVPSLIILTLGNKQAHSKFQRLKKKQDTKSKMTSAGGKRHGMLSDVASNFKSLPNGLSVVNQRDV